MSNPTRNGRQPGPDDWYCDECTAIAVASDDDGQYCDNHSPDT